MHTLKKTALLFLLVLQTAAIFARGNAEAPSQNNGQLPEISIGILPDVDSIPVVIAHLNGYFEENGIKVQIQQFKNPVDRDTAFQAGDTNLVISDLLSAALFRNGGFKVKALSLTNGSYKMLAAPASGAENIQDMTGKSIGISKNTIIEYATDRMLAVSGLTGDDIKKEIIPQIPLRLQMLSAGQLDGATLPEPLATAAVSKGSTIIMSTDKLGINPGIILTKEDFIPANNAALSSFYRGYNMAVEYLKNTEKEQYIDKLIDFMGFPPAVRDNMQLPQYTNAAAPPQKEAAEVVEWLYARGLIEKEESYSALVDSSCLP